MKVAVTGATGRVGHAIAAHLVAQGHQVTTLGRRALPSMAHVIWDLTQPPPDLSGQDALVHAAFAHVAGKYRGGEGDDPATFRALNLDGTLRLFQQARDAGVGRILFLSSRAVYDGYPAGTALPDGLPARANSLYGQLKAEAEAWLAAQTGLVTASLRATGVYGPGALGQPHKWADLFAGYAKGETPPPRVGSEVHAGDLAAAVDLLLSAPAAALAPATFNISDILLDQHDLLAAYADLTGITHPLPPRADPSQVSVMACDRLRALGWQPRGMAGLKPAIRDLIG